MKEWTPATRNVTTLVAGLNRPMGVAVDGAGNVYIADTFDNVVSEWTAATSNVTTLISGLNEPMGVAVDGSGNIYIANTEFGYPSIMEWTATNNSVETLGISGLYHPYYLALDEAGNLYVASTQYSTVKEAAFLFVDSTAKAESQAAGTDALPVVLPTTANLLAPFAPTSDESWLTIDGITNGVVTFSFTANTGPSRTSDITVFGQPVPITQAGSVYFLGATTFLEGPAGGSDSVVLAVHPQAGAWTATANAGWLHLSPPYQSGAGSTNVVFSYDVNPGLTRTGTLTVAGLTLTVTQAGSTCVAAGAVTTLANISAYRVAVDSAGDVYIPNSGNNTIYEWTAADNTPTPSVFLGSYNHLEDVTVDAAGNLYITDSNGNAIYKWTPDNNTLTTLVSLGEGPYFGVTVDVAGNLYIADSGNNAIKMWSVASNALTTLVSVGLAQPDGVAADAAGNVYIADTGNSAIKEWRAVNNTVTTLVSSGLNGPEGVAVDGAGNVYIADTGNSAIKEWAAASSNVTTLVSSGLNEPAGVTVDGARNIYIADNRNSAIKELPYCFVDWTAKTESGAAGSDVLPPVLPATENLLVPFAPTSDESWLTIEGVTNGVVGFSFTANTGRARTARITLLGQTIPVTQTGPPYALGATALLEGPAGGTDSVVLAVLPETGAWTAIANASWLHLSPAYQSGVGSTNVVFSYDINPGPTRSGTLTIAGLTLTVTQAGSTYVAAGTVTTLVTSGLDQPEGVAVDGAGNVYIVDLYNYAIKVWTATNNTVSTLISSDLTLPQGVAVDGAGNVYVADYGRGAIDEWAAVNGALTTLVNVPYAWAVAVDGAVNGAGNVYIATLNDRTVKDWIAVNQTLVTLESGLGFPTAMAVDAAGNVYIADGANNAIKKWTAANANMTTLVSGLNTPFGVAVDGSGNVFIADTGNNAIKEWSAANGNVNILASSGLNNPEGVAMDSAGDVYFADTQTNAIKELPDAFVDPTPRLETAVAGYDQLPPVLPATLNLSAPFAPTSDESWLTIDGVTNGVVSFSFTTNAGSNRTAHISLLGQSIPVTQGVPATLPTLAAVQMLTNGVFQFAFSNNQGGSFTVLSVTNLAVPLSNWMVVGTASNIGPGLFEFASLPTTNDFQRFYRVRSP